SVDANGAIQVWDLTTGKNVDAPLLEEHSTHAHIKLVASNRRLIYVRPIIQDPENGGSQAFVRIAIWDLDSHRRLADANFPIDGPFSTIDTPADGQQIAISDGSLELFPVQQNADIERHHLCQMVGHGLTVNDWRTVGLEQFYQPTCQ